MYLKINNWGTVNRRLYEITLMIARPARVDKVEVIFGFFHVWDCRPWYYIDRKIATTGIKPEMRFTQGELNEVLDNTVHWRYFKFLRELYSADDYIDRIIGHGSSKLSHVLEIDTITKNSWIVVMRSDDFSLLFKDKSYDKDKSVIIHR